MGKIDAQGKRRANKAIGTIYRSIDLLIAALILSGQMTVISVWVTRGKGFGISFGGDITGRPPTVANADTPGADHGIYFIGLITALLMILDQVSVTGVFIGSGGYTIVISGPAFGTPKTVAYTQEAMEFLSDYREYVMQHIR